MSETFSSIPSAPNANCTYCGKPIIWTQKSDADMARAAAQNRDISYFHRPLDATKVSAGWIIVEGQAHYVYVHEIHVCDVAPLAREAYESKHVAAAAFYNQEIAQRQVRDENVERYGRHFSEETTRKRALHSVYSDFERETVWSYALRYKCEKCGAKKDEICTSLAKGKASFGEPVRRPHPQRYEQLSDADHYNIQEILARWRRKYEYTP
ncbi:hypothetical protein SEA_FORZA_41 [Gordonia phage Forza]|uniref:Uncharacterized protein n=1 Tax=Gordonia phage Forza TaxID=2571247 RepID=A0A650EY99_9CAUD|nr:hypothetical protein PP303_gp041 [Gordonia phage Forza]QEM41511.1 hypothetical protein SEA_BOOPY_42 [Gordonia phage Boopy]QGT55034.1 hypothetical protein SEA_FORZA_41 [Gordonia phage Forza]UXE04184.1 hypothetical protein SEA_BLUENGOLD_40 [Gordonia phage BlueNGold]WBF03823.1 hypothetical protein SEA_MAREELIH_40 [Gordonia phage Mareelih]